MPYDVIKHDTHKEWFTSCCCYGDLFTCECRGGGVCVLLRKKHWLPTPRVRVAFRQFVAAAAAAAAAFDNYDLEGLNTTVPTVNRLLLTHIVLNCKLWQPPERSGLA